MTAGELAEESENAPYEQRSTPMGAKSSGFPFPSVVLDARFVYHLALDLRA